MYNCQSVADRTTLGLAVKPKVDTRSSINASSGSGGVVIDRRGRITRQKREIDIHEFLSASRRADRAETVRGDDSTSGSLSERRKNTDTKPRISTVLRSKSASA